MNSFIKAAREFDEGSPLPFLERWRDVLEEMLEVSKGEERDALILLLAKVGEAIKDALIWFPLLPK